MTIPLIWSRWDRLLASRSLQSNGGDRHWTKLLQGEMQSAIEECKTPSLECSEDSFLQITLQWRLKRKMNLSRARIPMALDFKESSHGTIKTARHYIWNKMTKKSGAKKAAYLRNLRSKEQHCNEFAGFSFCFIYARLSSGEASNLEMPLFWKQYNILHSLSKGPGKEPPSKTENI